MKPLLYLAGILGLALTTALIAWQGFSVVYDALAIAGWGLVVVALFHVIPLFIDTLAWRNLLQDPHRPSLRVMVWMLWIREAVDALLPLAQVGGQLVGTRILMMHQVRGASAGASVVLELTLSVATQLLFTLMGLVLLLVLVQQDSGVALSVVAGVTLGSVIIYGFVRVQRRGLFQMLLNGLSVMAGGRRWLALVGGAARLDQAIAELYRQPRLLLTSSCWLLLSWLLGAGEVWLALCFLGHPIGLLESVLLESLGRAVRSASFMVPGSLGVQEGGFMVLGTLLGLSPETGLTISLAKRVRELLVGVPALIVWQWLESRHIWNDRVSDSESA
ncbi:MAG: lysylphosphatidylglycerol synthase domain-containing protein, partial [Pseudomonadota bacterium]